MSYERSPRNVFARTRKAKTGKGNVAENEPRTKGGQDKAPD